MVQEVPRDKEVSEAAPAEEEALAAEVVQVEEVPQEEASKVALKSWLNPSDPSREFT
jgi:hypothetical protein